VGNINIEFSRNASTVMDVSFIEVQDKGIFRNIIGLFKQMPNTNVPLIGKKNKKK